MRQSLNVYKFAKFFLLITDIKPTKSNALNSLALENLYRVNKIFFFDLDLANLFLV